MIQYVYNLSQRIIQVWELKLLTGISISIVAFFFDALQRDALIALLILIIIDFFSAVVVAYRNHEDITSARVFRTALKIVVYFSMVSAGFLAEKAVPLSILDDIILGFLVLTELVSILENFGKAGYAIPVKLLKRIREYKNEK